VFDDLSGGSASRSAAESRYDNGCAHSGKMRVEYIRIVEKCCSRFGRQTSGAAPGEPVAAEQYERDFRRNSG
jgi:hypothetical protein